MFPKVCVVVLVAIAGALAGTVTETPEGLKIEVKSVPDGCTVKSKNGDSLTMHYTGKLADGTVFDSR